MTEVKVDEVGSETAGLVGKDGPSSEATGDASLEAVTSLPAQTADDSAAQRTSTEISAPSAEQTDLEGGPNQAPPRDDPAVEEVKVDGQESQAEVGLEGATDAAAKKHGTGDDMSEKVTSSTVVEGPAPAEVGKGKPGQTVMSREERIAATKKARAERKQKARAAAEARRRALEAAARKRESDPEALRSEMEAACVGQEELWDSTRKWDPETSARLEAALQHIVKMHTPSPADKQARLSVLERLGAALAEEFGQAGVYLEPYGSFTTGIYHAGSDLDISVEGEWVADGRIPGLSSTPQLGEWSQKERAALLSKIVRILKIRKISRGYVEIIRGARVPIVKFVDADTGIHCDICIGNGGAAFKSEVMGYMASIDPRFVPLAVLVKKWAKVHEINNPTLSTFNSYALTLMVTFYLQTFKPAILPPICDLLAGNLGSFKGRPLDHGPYGPHAGAESLEVARTRAIRFREHGFGSKQVVSSLAELFAGFIVKMGAALSWWEKKGSGSVRISAWAGAWTVHAWDRHNYLVGVEDPFDATENCARTLGVRQWGVKASLLPRVVDVFHWTEDGLRELSPATGLASVLDELFGAGTAESMPDELTPYMRVSPDGTRRAPVVWQSPKRGNIPLKAGDMNFRESAAWKAGDARTGAKGKGEHTNAGSGLSNFQRPPPPPPRKNGNEASKPSAVNVPSSSPSPPSVLDSVALASVSLGSLSLVQSNCDENQGGPSSPPPPGFAQKPRPSGPESFREVGPPQAPGLLHVEPCVSSGHGGTSRNRGGRTARGGRRARGGRQQHLEDKGGDALSMAHSASTLQSVPIKQGASPPPGFPPQETAPLLDSVRSQPSAPPTRVPPQRPPRQQNTPSSSSAPAKQRVIPIPTASTRQKGKSQKSAQRSVPPSTSAKPEPNNFHASSVPARQDGTFPEKTVSEGGMPGEAKGEGKFGGKGRGRGRGKHMRGRGSRRQKEDAPSLATSGNGAAPVDAPSKPLVPIRVIQ